MFKIVDEHTIEVVEWGEGYGFRVFGPLVDDERGHLFASFDDAREYIAKRRKETEQQNREKLSITVLDDNGKPQTITGVHGGHFGALGIRDTHYVYPNEPWIAEALAELHDLESRSGKIRNMLSAYRIAPKPYGARTHQEAVERLKRDIASRTEAAAKGRPR